MKQRPTIFFVAHPKNWHSLLLNIVNSPLANIRRANPNDILQLDKADASNSIFIFERPPLYDEKGRKALQKALELANVVGVLDDENDPIILRCARDRRIVYFKRELVKNFFTVDSGLRYSLSLYKFAKWGFHGFLTPAEAFQAVRTGYVLPLPLTVTRSEQQAVSPNSFEKRPFSVSFVATVRSGWGNLGGYVPKMLYVRERLGVANTLARIPNSYVRITGEVVGEPSQKKLGITSFYEVIRNSVSSVAVRGVGYDSARYWEIPSVQTVLVARKPPIVIPNNFVDGREAFFFRNHGELEKIVKMLDLDRTLARKVAAAGYEKYLRYHSPEKRLLHMIDSMRSRDN